MTFIIKLLPVVPAISQNFLQLHDVLNQQKKQNNIKTFNKAQTQITENQFREQ